MNNSHIMRRILFPCFFFLFGLNAVSGQNKEKANEKSLVKIEIVDNQGNPVKDARIASSRNRYIYDADKDGKASASLYKDDQIKIMAEGFATKFVSVNKLKSGKVVMDKTLEGAGESNRLYTVFGETNERRTVGAYSKVDGKDLEANPTMYLMDALGGRLNGLFTMDNTLVPGFTNSTDFVRTSLGDVIVMVDGVERSLDYLEPETIESVQLLKDASLKSLYGGIQTNGILMIKTKRGRAYENSMKVNVQTGIQKPTRLPEYLNSYDYATLYNQALINSGLSPYYKNPEAYKNGDAVVYPDVDYYNMFLNDQMSITRASAQYTGGNDKTTFFTHLGFQTNGGLEKYTKYPNRDQVFTLRGNVDNKITDAVTFRAGFNAALQNKQWPDLSTQSFFNMLSDNRPNEFPIFIPGEKVGLPDKEFVLGGTAQNQNNVYGYLMNNGYAQRDYSYIQSDFTFDFSLDKWVKGLSLKANTTFDMYNVLTSSQGATFLVYEPILNQDQSDMTGFKTWGQDTRETSLSRTGDQTQRNFAYNFTANYDRTFGKHSINALLTYFQQTKEFSTLAQSLKRLNVGGLVNYMYDNKYTGELSLNYVGVGSFAPDKRFGTFPTFGLGWIASEESFMKDLTWMDYLKLRASYGILGSTTYTADGLFSSYLYRDVWNTSGTYNVSGFNNIAQLSTTGNPDLGFQKSKEFNAGIDFTLFSRSLKGSVGYFQNKLDGVFANLSDITPGVLGKGAALMMQNYKQYVSSGWEAEMLYEKQVGDWRFSAGANFCYGKTDITKEVEPNYPEEFNGLRKIKTMGDVLGLEAIGVFADQADIDNSPAQLFGKVMPGDIKYKDTNDDKVIDNKDRVVVANTLPTIEYGVTLKVAYKGFNLDVLGYGLSGFDRTLDNKYYQIYGNRKYSNVLIDGLPNGNPHPILRAEYSNNNFLSSDYWVVDGSYFKIRDVELGYTFPHQFMSKIGINSLKLFTRGTNLMTLSKIKDLDPENLTAGISNFPLCMTITGGLSFSF